MSNDNEFDQQEFFQLFFNDEVPFSYKFWLVATVGLYTISPIDFLPEGLLGVLGFADDFGIMIAASQIFTHFANKRLEREHEQAQEQTAQSAQPNTIYYAESAQPQQQLTNDAPRVIQNRDRAGRLPAPGNRQQQHPQEAPPHDYLHDERHEQLIAQKRQQTDSEFDELVRRREQEKGTPDDWDFNRNNPVNRKHNDDSNP